MFTFSFGNMDLPTYTIETYVGNALIQTQTIRPLAFEMLVMQFAGLCEQIANEQQPMKCVCRGMKDIQKPNGDWTQKEARVEFYNNHWGEEDIPKE